MNKKQLTQLICEMIEQAIEEATYPEGFDVATFKALPSFAARIRYVKERLPKIAQGSARAVFTIDNDTVLKVAMNAKGKAQNEVEADIGRWDNYPVAKVFEVGDQGLWIEMQKATKATPKVFKQISGIDISTFNDIVVFYSMEKRGVQWRVRPENYREILDTNNFIQSVVGLMADYDMPGGDIGRISSWGVVNDNGKPTLVLIDYGLTNTVYNDFYDRSKKPTYNQRNW